MASSPNREEEEYDEDEYEEDEDSDEEDEEYDSEAEALNTDSDEEDEEYDSEAEALNAAVAASLEESEAAVEDSPEVEIIEAAPNQEDRDRENEEEEEGLEEEDEEERGKCEIGGSEFDRAASWPNCTICLDPWTSNGPHRVCCIPCGHVYGKSCLEKWLRCRKSAGKCLQCNRKFKPKEIINLYALLIVVPNDDLEKEVRSLREDNEILKLENSRLQEEVMQKYTDLAQEIMQLQEQDREWRRRMTQQMADLQGTAQQYTQQFPPTQQLSSQIPYLSYYRPPQYPPSQYSTLGSYQSHPLTQPGFSYLQEDFESFRQYMAWRTRHQGDDNGGSH